MEESYPMTGGDGQFSYAKHSNLQKEAANFAKALLVETIAKNVDVEHICPKSNPFRIADLGCSVGPNTYIAVKNIIEAVVQKFHSKGHSGLPDFHVFFNDHVFNDFNLLFANLPPKREYFAAGVPGSFHKRLFPKASLNFIYSAYALQWLSTMPPELRDLNSPLCNKGRIYYSNAPSEVCQAYLAQYTNDIGSFLCARAEELAPGGLMAILSPGRDDDTPAQSFIFPHIEDIESCLVDMANEGIISKDKIDRFNLPMYCPSKEELRTLILKNGCFDIVRLDGGPLPLKHRRISAEECRAGLECILSKHFGSENMDDLFDRYSKITERPLISAATNGYFKYGIALVIILKRKNWSLE